MNAKIRARLKHCVGCHDNFYNHGGRSMKKDGLCMSIHRSKVIWRKEVHVDQRPPWKQKAERFLDCYHRPRYAYLPPNVTC